MTEKMREYKIYSGEPACSYKEKSKICKETISNIIRHNNKELERCIEDDSFDPNERFDSNCVARENYINYACNNSNFDAARIISKKYQVSLDSYDKERLLLELIYKRKFALLYSLISSIEGRRISIGRFIKGIIKQDYDSIVEGPKRTLKE